MNDALVRDHALGSILLFKEEPSLLSKQIAPVVEIQDQLRPQKREPIERDGERRFIEITERESRDISLAAKDRDRRACPQ
jgi:hypothetical protein